jgi:DNA polymerase-1
LFLGHLPFSIAHIQPNPVYIKSIDAFDRMMEKLNSAQVIAVDSETESANKIANKLLMVQFATSSKKGYVLPLYHKDTPFSASQLKYIEGKLREFFMQKPGPDRYLIGQNFKFDIQQFTQQLGIPYFYWEFWDLMAGEFVYDENLGAVAKYSLQGKKGHYGLDSMTCHYGNDWYFKAPFSKDERATISSVKLDRNVLNYGAMDVQVPFAIHKMQIKKASLESFKKRDNSYGPVYSRFVRKQMANNIFMFAHMEHTGVPADLKWLMQLKSKTGPIRQVLNETLKDFYKYKAVQKANALLIKKSKIPQKGLWGQTVSWVFSLTKPEHKALLFFKVLDLEPVNESAKTGKPSVDKDFQKVHAEVPEVATFTRISKLEKLVSSFVTPFLNTITKDKDGKVDGRIRPEFGFIKVVTGRSNSSKPNFQQIPSRSKEAKLIKRIFIAPRGKLIIKMDFMAHEVRLWSHVSLDEVLAELFRVGREIRKKLFRTNHQTHPDILAKLRKNAKVQGDIHIQNVKYFFNKDVDKDHPLRDAIKAIIFGVIYGMHFRTLAEGIGKTPAFAEELMNKLFNRFKKAKRWLDYMKSFAAKNLYSYSPLGRCRHLYGYLLGNLAADRAMDRRADNAPIQGLGADDGHTGARLFLQNCYEFLLKTGRMKPEDRKMPIAVRTMVHDAIFSEANYRNVFASLHLLHHSCTNGLMDYYAKHFGVEYPVTTEIEIEIGVDESRLYKWDFSQEGLVDIIEKALADIPSLYPEEDVDEARRLIYKDMNNDKIKAYLARKYTILDGADYEGIDYEKLLAQVQKRNKIALKEAA